MSIHVDAVLAVFDQFFESSETFKPPQDVQDTAKKALEKRKEKPDSQKGMTDVGLARARDLSNGRAVSLETIKRMKNYFDRHEVDKNSDGWDDWSKGRQAWDGWGGDPGREWAEDILDKHGDD